VIKTHSYFSYNVLKLLDMKVFNRYTKLIIVAISLIGIMSSCEEDIARETFGDLAYLVSDTYSKNIKTDDNVIEVLVTHRNKAIQNGKAKLIFDFGDVAEGVFTPSTDVVDFSQSDTIAIDVTVDYNALEVDVSYSIGVSIASNESGYLEPMLFDDGNASSAIGALKFVPFVKENLVGTYSATSESYYDGSVYTYDMVVEYLSSDGDKHVYKATGFVDAGWSFVFQADENGNVLFAPYQYLEATNQYLLYDDATGSFYNSGNRFDLGMMTVVDWVNGVYYDRYINNVYLKK